MSSACRCGMAIFSTFAAIMAKSDCKSVYFGCQTRKKRLPKVNKIAITTEHTQVVAKLFFRV
jgi:hypothetical protein